MPLWKWRVGVLLAAHVQGVSTIAWRCVVVGIAVVPTSDVSAEAASRAPESVPASFSVGEEVVDLFEASQFSIESEAGPVQVLPYRLFKPEMDEAGTAEKYPLIVWLHGFGYDERVFPNLGQLQHTQLVFRDAHRERYPFFFLAPQNVFSPKWFREPNERKPQESPAPGELVVALVAQLVKQYPIDPDRITLVGISSGGKASWEFVCRYPDLFAGVAPLASGGTDLEQLDPMADVPTWAFQSAGDQLEGVRHALAQLERLGGPCHLTEIPGKNHDCWYWAFHDYGLLDWLLAQRKGSHSSPAPGAQTLSSRWRLLSKQWAATRRAYWPQMMSGAAIAVAVVLMRRFQWFPGRMPSVKAHDATPSED